jgi:hypothetical protein
MNGVTLLLRELHHGESSLVADLRQAAEQHHADHEVHHGATDLATWSEEHVRLLAHAGDRRGLHLSEEADEASGVLQTLREKAAELLGRRPEPSLLLLHDLRDLHLTASRNSLHWEMLAQTAQAQRDSELLELAGTCHPQTLRQMRWTNTLIKEFSPQTFTSL